MSKLEDQQLSFLTPEEKTKNEEIKHEPSLREMGRARIERIGSFFSSAKENLKNKAKRAGESISGAAGRVKEIGIAGLEMAMATPEAIGRGVEFGVGATEMAYQKSREAAIATKEKVIEKKNAVIQKGKDGIELGVQTAVDARDATLEFGNRALYRAAERVSRPFLEFQGRRLSHTLRYMAERVERGKVSKEDYEEVKRLLAHMEGLRAI